MSTFQVIYRNKNGDAVLVSRIQAPDTATAKEQVRQQAAYGHPLEAFSKGATTYRIVPL